MILQTTIRNLPGDGILARWFRPRFAVDQPVRAARREFGLAYDENDLADAWRDCLAGAPPEQAAPQVEADEFEQRFGWFLA